MLNVRIYLGHTRLTYSPCGLLPDEVEGGLGSGSGCVEYLEGSRKLGSNAVGLKRGIGIDNYAKAPLT